MLFVHGESTDGVQNEERKVVIKTTQGFMFKDEELISNEDVIDFDPFEYYSWVSENNKTQ